MKRPAPGETAAATAGPQRERLLHFLVPGDIATRTGGYLYDARLVEGLPALGWPVRLHALPGDFPHPAPASLAAVHSLLAGLPDGAPVLVDGLAFGVLAGQLAPHAGRLRLVALVHHPLADETGIDARTARRLAEAERTALALARRVLATSRRTAAQLVRDYGVPPAHVAAVEPGTESAPLAPAPRGRRLRFLCVATLTPRKGHRLLVEALARLAHLPWRLDCIGSLRRDPGTVRDVSAAIRRAGLRRRIRLHGELDEAALARAYARAHLFVLPTLHEGYGMALAEAIARGLPVLSTTAGAVPDTVGRHAGLLVPPGDAEALDAALRQVLEDRHALRRLRAGARRRRGELPPWQDTCQGVATLLDRCVATP